MLDVNAWIDEHEMMVLLVVGCASPGTGKLLTSECPPLDDILEGHQEISSPLEPLKITCVLKR